MKPVLLSYGPIALYGYGTCLAVGVLLAIALVRSRCHGPLVGETLVWTSLWLAIAGLVGSRIYALIELQFVGSVNTGTLTDLLHGTGGAIGGVSSAIAALAVAARVLKWPFWDVANQLAPGVLLGLAFGKIGCLLGGCCWGTRSGLAWAVVFPDSAALISGVPTGVPLHPVQLYEAGAAAILCCLVLLLLNRSSAARRWGGLRMVIATYAPARFICEAWRDAAPVFGPLSFAQGMMVLATLWAVFGVRSGAKSRALLITSSDGAG